MQYILITKDRSERGRREIHVNFIIGKQARQCDPNWKICPNPLHLNLKIPHLTSHVLGPKYLPMNYAAIPIAMIVLTIANHVKMFSLLSNEDDIKMNHLHCGTSGCRFDGSHLEGWPVEPKLLFLLLKCVNKAVAQGLTGHIK